MRKVVKLANGIRVAIEQIDFAHSVSAGVWVATGSRWENDKNNGVAHFIEHLLFKGTKKRTAKEIVEEIENEGGSLNAFTSRECTCFYSKALADDLDLSLDILSDMLLNPIFDAGEIEKEKNVVLEEINMYEDAPDELVHDLHIENIFRDHPLGKNILGTIDSIKNMTREDIVDFYHRNYTPENTVISIAGNIDINEALVLVEKYFGEMQKMGETHQLLEPIPVGDFYFADKQTEQINFCLGRSSFERTHPDYYILVVLNNILGGSGSSRLFQEVREEKGLVYSIYSYYSSFCDTGVFAVYGGTSLENLSEVLQIVQKIFHDITENGVDEVEVERTKRQIKAQILFNRESVSSRMKAMGSNIVNYGRIIEEEEIIENLDKVTIDGIKKFAGEFLDPQTYCFTVIGDKKTQEDIKREWEKTFGVK